MRPLAIEEISRHLDDLEPRVDRLPMEGVDIVDDDRQQAAGRLPAEPHRHDVVVTGDDPELQGIVRRVLEVDEPVALEHGLEAEQGLVPIR